MEKNERVNGNILIADFIEMKRMKSVGWEHCYVGAIKPEDLTFHKDWNLLMHAYQKYKRIVVPESKKRLHEQSVEAIGIHILNGEILEAFKMLAADLEFWSTKNNQLNGASQVKSRK